MLLFLSLERVEQFKAQYQKCYANDTGELKRYGFFKKSKARVTKQDYQGKGGGQTDQICGCFQHIDRDLKDNFEKAQSTYEETVKINQEEVMKSRNVVLLL